MAPWNEFAVLSSSVCEGLAACAEWRLNQTGLAGGDQAKGNREGLAATIHLAGSSTQRQAGGAQTGEPRRGMLGTEELGWEPQDCLLGNLINYLLILVILTPQSNPHLISYLVDVVKRWICLGWDIMLRAVLSCVAAQMKASGGVSRRAHPCSGQGQVSSPASEHPRHWTCPYASAFATGTLLSSSHELNLISP